MAGRWFEPPLLGPDGSVTDPLVVVDGARRQPPDLPHDRILVGVAPLPRSLSARADLVLVPSAGSIIGRRSVRDRRVAVADPHATAERLARRTADHPRAAVVLAQVLRAVRRLPIPAALAVESFAYSTLLGGPEFGAWMSARGPRPLPPAAARDPVLVDRDGATLHLTLNRPERRNAYGRELRDALVAGLAVAELDDGVSAVLLDGAGPGFCAGGDLDEFGTAPDPVTAHLLRTEHGAAAPLARIADRLTVRLHGPCIGAGIELAAFAGWVEADPSTSIVLPELAMGLIPGAGGTVSIPRRIGVARFLYLALTGEPIDVWTATAWGLVDTVHPPSAALP